MSNLRARPWTQAEDRLLRSMFAEKQSTRAIAQALRRTEELSGQDEQSWACIQEDPAGARRQAREGCTPTASCRIEFLRPLLPS